MDGRGTPPGWDTELGAPITVRVSRRARRIALRVITAERGVELILPRGVPAKLGWGFLATKRGWIAARLGALPGPVPFAEGAIIPVLGVPHRVRCVEVPTRTEPARTGLQSPNSIRGSIRGGERDSMVPGAAIAEGEIRIRGDAPDLARAVRDHLIALARSELSRRVQGCAARLGRRVGRIGVREMHSRWGSCSARGNLSFCWRLVLAPESVLDYVVAHEVAHLVEMNHGPRFWHLVDTLYPDNAAPRAWLKEHRAELLSYGGTRAKN